MYDQNLYIYINKLSSFKKLIATLHTHIFEKLY